MTSTVSSVFFGTGEVSPRRPWEEKEVLPMKRSNNALTDFFAAFSVPTN